MNVFKSRPILLEIQIFLFAMLFSGIASAAPTEVDIGVTVAKQVTGAPEYTDPVVAGFVGLGSYNANFRIVVKNFSLTDAATNLLIDTTAILPSGVSISIFAGGAGTYVDDGGLTVTGTGTWTIPSLAANTETYLNFYLVVDPSTAHGAVISMKGAFVSMDEFESGPELNEQTTTLDVVRESDIRGGKKTLNDVVSVVAGTNLTYIITAKNHGSSPSNAANVTISETAMPPGTTFVSVAPVPDDPDFGCSTEPLVGETGPLVCTWADDTAPGDTKTLHLVVKVDADAVAGSTTQNKADTKSDSTDTSPGNNNGKVTVTITRESDLSIVKGVNLDTELVVPGGTFRYNITVTNAGPSYADNVVVKDTLPSGLTPTLLPMIQGCVWAAPVITCTRPELPVTGNPAPPLPWLISFDVDVAEDIDFGPIKNIATIESSDSYDPTDGEDEWMDDADIRVVPAIPSEDTAVLAIQKRFSDENSETPVTLNLQCSTGTYSPISVTMHPDDNDQPWGQYGQYEHIFVIEKIALVGGKGATCTVIESPVSGYSAEYKCKVDDAMSDADSSCIPQGYSVPEDNYACKWNDVQEGDSNYCLIVNDPDPVTVSVTKVWEVVNMGGKNFTQDVDITLYCQGDMLGDEGSSGGYEYRRFYLDESDYVDKDGKYDGTATVTVKVVPDWYPTAVPPAKQQYTKCYAEEDFVASAVEMESDCGNRAGPGMNIAVGMGDSCTITNTMFFEGIPTLNQWGMAIMALLMLGMGLIGFRRFA